MRIGLIIEYDGTRFHGSQLQTAGQRTVQGELETALADLYGKATRAHFASRTDSGVHAVGQAVAFDVAKHIETDAIMNALNDRLPRDVKVQLAQAVPDDFDPRRAAIGRVYAYNLLNAPAPPVVKRNYIAHQRQPLNIALMQTAAQALVGEHDFVSFAGPATPPDASTTRRVQEATVTADARLITITITANAFLHQQVRRIVGALIAVGAERLAPSEFETLITNGHKAGWTKMAPANGLILQRVIYKDGQKLPPKSAPNAHKFD